jgi:hypothetical protein
MPHRKNEKPVRIPKSLWNHIAEIAKLQERNTDRRGPHTHLANEMIAAAVAKWMYSPYVCLQAQHVALITSDGHVFFRTVQYLSLNSDRQKLPCVVQMKPEKRDDYFHQYQELRPPRTSRCDWLERRWIVNHFAAWQGQRLGGEPLSCAVDRLGIESKIVDLPLSNLNGSSLTREMVAGWRDYVQWQDGKPAADVPKYDRLAFNIDLPTTNFECLVFVDEDLYPGGQGNPRLELEFRNRERAKFADKDVVTAFDENRIPHLQSSAGTLDDTPDLLVGRLRELLERLRGLADSRADDGRSVVSEPDAALIRSLQLPQRFLYLDMAWPSPHWGIQICVHWKKPSRASAETPRAPTAPSTRGTRDK